MGISALSVAIAPPPDQRVQEPSSSPSAGGPAAPAEQPDVIEQTISAEAAEATTVEIPLGATVRLTVTAKALDGVEIEALDRFAGVSPDAPAEFELYADRAGSYDVRLVESGRLVGRLEVSSPR